MSYSKKISREQQEKAIVVAAEKEHNDNRLKNYVVPESKKELLDSLPTYFNEVRKHSKYVNLNFGQPPKFTPAELTQQLDDLFEYSAVMKIPVNISTICAWLGTDRSVVSRWENDENNPLSRVIKDAKEFVVANRIINGETNATNPIFSMFVLKTQHGFQETSNVNIKAEAVTGVREQVSDSDVIETVEQMIERGELKP